MSYTQKEAENCLAIVLTICGQEGRARIREVLLENVTDPERGDDCRRALDVLNRWERAFEELERRTRT